MRRLLALTAVVAMTSPIIGRAAEFTFDHSIVTMRGPIAPGDGAQLDRFLSASHNNNHPLTTLVLESPGGPVVEGMALADAVRAYRVNTVVPQDATCASACFLPFAAGDHMTVEKGARVGIHSATSTGGHGDDDGHATLVMARYAAQLGVPPAIIGRMVETDSINMTWLDGADLKAMGANIPGSAAVQTAAVPKAAVSKTTKSPPYQRGFYAWLFGAGGPEVDQGVGTRRDATMYPLQTGAQGARATSFFAPAPARLHSTSLPAADDDD